MSGGYWDYSGFRTSEHLFDVSETPEVHRRWPKLARAFGELAREIEKLEHDMDWDLSGDTYIKDDRAFDAEGLRRLRAALDGQTEEGAQ